VIEVDTLRAFVIGRRRSRRLRLAVLHSVLIVPVLEVLRRSLLIQILRRCSCSFVALPPLHHPELLVL
jgi:hypothetical protein